MSKCTNLILAFAFSLAAASTIPAAAATVSDTLKACKNSPGCGFKKNKVGDYNGCSPKSKGGNGTCFYCDTSKNNCFQVRRTPTGKLHRISGDVLTRLGARPTR
jgi:uncharacterized protein YbbK (DUF523 family)